MIFKEFLLPLAFVCIQVGVYHGILKMSQLCLKFILGIIFEIKALVFGETPASTFFHNEDALAAFYNGRAYRKFMFQR